MRLNKIQRTENGILLVRILKSDGGWHRTAIEPGEDVDRTMAAVNAHLRAMGCEPCADYAPLVAEARKQHTPELVAKFKAERERNERAAKGIR